MTRVTVDLGAWTNVPIQLRWHAGDDPTDEAVGWYVDSVTLSNIEIVAACGPAFFADGFEGGSLPGPWGGVAPR